MLRKKITALVCVLAVLGAGVSGSAIAESNELPNQSDGNELLLRCNSAIRAVESGERPFMQATMGAWCLGFVQGFTQTNGMYRAGGRKVIVCLPKNGVTNVQGARIIVKYLTDHPEQLHELAITIAFVAFVEAFPCDVDNE